MINKLTGRPTKVHCTGDILVALDQIDEVEQLLSKNKIMYNKVQYDEKSGGSRAAAMMLELKRGTDVVDAQRLLDRMP